MLLFNQEQVWMKKGGKSLDVMMRAYNRAEICKLVEIFLLNKISTSCNKNNGSLHRDDGLSIFKTKNRQKLKKTKNNLQKLFNDFKSYYRKQFKNRKLFGCHFKPKRWNISNLP